MVRKISTSGLSGYEATTKDDLPSPPDPEYQYGSLAQGAEHLNLSPKREISAKHIYEELQNYISAFTLESPRSKAEAAVMKVELYKAAFPHGALSKGTTIRGTYTYGGEQFFEMQQYLKDMAHTDIVELRTTAIRERVALFKAAFPKGIYALESREKSHAAL